MPHRTPCVTLMCVLNLMVLAMPSCGWPFPMPLTIGPALRFSRAGNSTAYYSLLVGVNGTQDAVAPCVNLTITQANVTNISKLVLDEYGGYTFLRWEFGVAQDQYQHAVKYQVASNCSNVQLNASASIVWTFYVPADSVPWHWGYYSCNGWLPDAGPPPGGIGVMWNDLLERHAEDQLHLVAGNGDQVYNDGVLSSHPDIESAANADSPEPTLTFNWTNESRSAASDWYFSHYAYHWTLQSESYREALANVPFTMMVDDHELFNGYGSQQTKILQSPLVTVLAQLGRRFYLLFEQHSTSDNLMPDLAWNNGGPALHTCSQMGPTTAFLALDERFERTRFQVLSNDSYTRIQQRLDALPTTVQQLFVLSPQPMAVPLAPEVENKALGVASTFGLDNFTQLLTALENDDGALASALSTIFPFTQFGSIDLSDVLDQWSSLQHQPERARLVHLLQAWSLARSARVTYIAGDSHFAYAQQFSSPGSVPPAQDYRYSLSLISSAIGNHPNTEGAKALEASGAYQANITTDETTQTTQNGTTVITELAPFGDVSGLPPGSNYAAAARNWADITGTPQGGVQLTLRFEAYTWRLVPFGKTFSHAEKTFTVPPLVLNASSRAA